MFSVLNVIILRAGLGTQWVLNEDMLNRNMDINLTTFLVEIMQW